MSRRCILSPARAAEIVDNVAKRFDLPVERVFKSKREYMARTARGEIAYRLADELGWSQRRIAAHLDCGKTTVWALLRDREKLVAAFQDRVAAEHRVFLQSPEALELQELREKLKRLSGGDIAEDFADGLNLPKRCAIVLAILAEAYPRAVSIEAMCELYDDACQRLAYGFQRGADRELIRKNVSDLNREFAKAGRPMPAEIAPPVGGRRLSDVAAAMLSPSFGVPRAHRMLMADEKRAFKAELRMSA